MELDVQLSTKQIKQIASYISLQNIQEYLEYHKEENEQFLSEDENNEDTEDKTFTSNNSIWSFYTDDTTCEVVINKFRKGENENECNNLC